MGRAGAEKCLINLLKSMDYDRCEISLYSLINMGELFGEVPAQVRILNENPDPDSVLSRRGRSKMRRSLLKKLFCGCYFLKYSGYFFKTLWFQLKTRQFDAKKLLWKLVADTGQELSGEYDLAIAYMQGAATYYLRDRVKAGKKVAFVHNDLITSGYDMTAEAVYYREMDHIFCVSKTVRERLLAAIPDVSEKAEIFYNILDEEEIRAKSLQKETLLPAWSSTGKEIRLLTLARLSYMKGYDLAVEAMRLICRTNEAVRWYALGDGEERKNIEKLIRKYGLEDRFILLGSVQNPYPYLADCDIYVHVSRWEGYCTAISEAFVLEKPVIASCYDANREQLERNRRGILVDLNPESIARGILSMMEEISHQEENKTQEFQEAKAERAKERKDNIEKLYRLAQEGKERK